MEQQKRIWKVCACGRVNIWNYHPDQNGPDLCIKCGASLEWVKAENGSQASTDNSYLRDAARKKKMKRLIDKRWSTK